MQRISIDKYIESLSKKIGIKNINRQIKENIGNLIYSRRYFLKLWYSINNISSKKVCKFYDSKSILIKQIKSKFLFNLQKEWILVCSYCWKTSNIHWKLNDKFVRLYDIEHFLPRSKYPYLSVNLYNWLPVCKACNETLKSGIDTLQDTSKNKKLFHPYFWWIYKEEDKIKVEDKTFDEEVTFYWNEENDIKNRKQVFTTHHWKFFRLGEIYLNDQETFNIFQFIYDKYTQIKEEYSRFKENSKSVEEFVDYFLKNYYPEDEQDILKYSNWKLKKDLIENMKRILEEELENDN